MESTIKLQNTKAQREQCHLCAFFIQKYGLISSSTIYTLQLLLLE